VLHTTRPPCRQFGFPISPKSRHKRFSIVFSPRGVGKSNEANQRPAAIGSDSISSGRCLDCRAAAEKTKRTTTTNRCNINTYYLSTICRSTHLIAAPVGTLVAGTLGWPTWWGCPAVVAVVVGGSSPSIRDRRINLERLAKSFGRTLIQTCETAIHQAKQRQERHHGPLLVGARHIVERDPIFDD
jgi:hypothetical protein